MKYTYSTSTHLVTVLMLPTLLSMIKLLSENILTVVTSRLASICRSVNVLFPSNVNELFTFLPSNVVRSVSWLTANFVSNILEPTMVFSAYSFALSLTNWIVAFDSFANFRFSALTPKKIDFEWTLC